MESIDVVVPLALIEIIAVLRKTCRINDTEIGILRRRPCSHRSGPRAVPRSRLADIVKACPYIFACNKVAGDHIVPCCTRKSTPAYSGIVVGGQFLVRRCLCSAVSEPVIDAPAVDG